MKTFGLIGQTLSHSFSKKYFSEKFQKENIVAQYNNYELQSIKEFTNLIKENTLSGLNVTIPYKESIIPFLDELVDEGKQIGAVNTIKFTSENKLVGYNTDAYGFAQSIKPFLNNHHERALILGSGGASKAICFVLNQLGIDFLIVSRNPEAENEISYSDLNEHYINAFKLIINTSPVGTFPQINEYPNIPYEYLSKDHLLYDLVYNPKLTAFLKKGKERETLTLNGLDMLKHQAEKAWKIWNS